MYVEYLVPVLWAGWENAYCIFPRSIIYLNSQMIFIHSSTYFYLIYVYSEKQMKQNSSEDFLKQVDSSYSGLQWKMSRHKP